MLAQQALILSVPSPPPQTNLLQEKQSLRIRLGCSLVTEPSMCKALSSVFSIKEKQQILYTNSTQSVLSHVGLTQIYRKVFGVQSFRMAHVWPRITCLLQRKQRLGTMTRPSQCHIRAVPLFAISGTEGRGEQVPPLLLESGCSAQNYTGIFTEAPSLTASEGEGTKKPTQVKRWLQCAEDG